MSRRSLTLSAILVLMLGFSIIASTVLAGYAGYPYRITGPGPTSYYNIIFGVSLKLYQQIF